MCKASCKYRHSSSLNTEKLSCNQTISYLCIHYIYCILILLQFTILVRCNCGHTIYIWPKSVRILPWVFLSLYVVPVPASLTSHTEIHTSANRFMLVPKTQCGLGNEPFWKIQLDSQCMIMSAWMHGLNWVSDLTKKDEEMPLACGLAQLRASVIIMWGKRVQQIVLRIKWHPSSYPLCRFVWILARAYVNNTLFHGQFVSPDH